MNVVKASRVVNTVEFVVDKNSLKAAKDALNNLQKAAKAIEGPRLNVKKFRQQAKEVEKAIQDANKAASKPRDNSEKEKARAAKAAARAEAQAAKEAARVAQRKEKAELKVLDVAQSLKNMQSLSNQEITRYVLEASKIARAYGEGEKSLQRMNSEMKRLQAQARKLNATRRENANIRPTGGNRGSNGAIEGAAIGGGAKLAAGAAVGYAAYKGIEWGRSALEANGEKSEIVQRARLGNVDFNALQAQSQFAFENGIDSGMGVQGMRKLLDNYKDIQERLGESITNSELDKKSGKWKGGNAAVDAALNMGFTKADLQKYKSNPMGFVSAYTNTMQGKGYSQEQILHNLEDLGDDLGLYAIAFSNGGKALTDQAETLKRNGQWLSDAQQDQLVNYRKFNQEMGILNDSSKSAFFQGFMESLDPQTMKELSESSRELLPLFNGLGQASGELTTSFLKGVGWIAKTLTDFNGDMSTGDKVAIKYGSKANPETVRGNAVANAYGASQPKADGTHEPNVFDVMRDWWLGTSGKKDVSSYAQSASGDYSPVAMLRQSAMTVNIPPAMRQTLQPVVIDNRLPEGMIALNITPDPTFGNIINARIEQQIRENNMSLVLGITGGQSN